MRLKGGLFFRVMVFSVSSGLVTETHEITPGLARCEAWSISYLELWIFG